MRESLTKGEALRGTPLLREATVHRQNFPLRCFLGGLWELLKQWDADLFDAFFAEHGFDPEAGAWCDNNLAYWQRTDLPVRDLGLRVHHELILTRAALQEQEFELLGRGTAALVSFDGFYFPFSRSLYRQAHEVHYCLLAGVDPERNEALVVNGWNDPGRVLQWPTDEYYDARLSSSAEAGRLVWVTREADQPEDPVQRFCRHAGPAVDQWAQGGERLLEQALADLQDAVGRGDTSLLLSHIDLCGKAYYQRYGYSRYLARLDGRIPGAGELAQAADALSREWRLLSLWLTRAMTEPANQTLIAERARSVSEHESHLISQLSAVLRGVEVRDSR